MSGDGTDVLERAYFAKEAGATALMVATGLVGSGWLHKLATDEKLRLPIIHHPAYSGGFVSPGVSGIADYLQLGFLPRLILALIMMVLYPMEGALLLPKSNVSVLPRILNIL